MSEQKPDWYGLMKQTEPSTKRTFTIDHIRAIEEKIEGIKRNKNPFKNKNVILLTAVASAFVLIIVGILFNGLNIHTVNQPTQTQTQILTLTPAITPTMEPIVYADEQWKVSREEFNLYANYAESKSDSLLAGLEPLEVFRWYVISSRTGDRDTTYALLNKDEGTSTPSKAEYDNDFDKDPAGVERSKKKWESYYSEYRLEQTIEGDTATILLIPVHKPDTGENRQFFGLTKTNEGVWKANWLAMQ